MGVVATKRKPILVAIIQGPALLDGTILEADICVVGSGAAGLAVATEFLQSATSVLLVEGGGEKVEKVNQELYRAEVVGFPHAGIHQGRFRVFGGSTTRWAGQVLPLSEIDFQIRDWVKFSGWPFQASDIAPHYARAEDFLGVKHLTYDLRSWPPRHSPPNEFLPGTVEPCFSQFARTPDLAQKYRSKIARSRNVKLLMRATVVSLIPNSMETHLHRALAKMLDGRSIEIRAKVFVVCCGGIDSARLLLASKAYSYRGVGNKYDVVGRFFQDHVSIDIPARINDQVAFGRAYNAFRRRERLYVIKLALSPTMQKRAKVLNVACEVTYPFASFSALPMLKRKIVDAFERDGVYAAALELMRSAGSNLKPIVNELNRRYIRNVPAFVGLSQPHLSFYSEQEPNPESRVTLSTVTDEVGMPRSVLDWRRSKREDEAIETLAAVLWQEWDRLGITHETWNPIELLRHDLRRTSELVDQYHHIGTTRMGEDPKTSVVDARCRVHGYDNLYVGSSSVFPTGGSSNPTLTIVAISIRIADHIKATLNS